MNRSSSYGRATKFPHIMKLLLCLPVLVSTAMVGRVLLEAEQFADAGGWDVDQQ